MAPGRKAGAIAAVAAAGALVLALQIWIAHAEAVGRRSDGRSWAWLVSFIGLPVVAFIGASAAPRRVRAVVIAALAAELAFYVFFKAMTLIRLGSVGAQMFAWQLALVAVTGLAGRAGSQRVSTTRSSPLLD